MSDEKKSVAPILLAAAVGAAVGAAAVIILSTAGDEAPIRVKNGSLKMELVHDKQKFKDKSAKKEWEIDGGKKGGVNFEVYFAASSSQAGCTVRKANGPTVVITMNDGTTVTLSVSANNTTQIVAAKELNAANDDRTLEYGTADTYVASIAVGGQSCVLSAKDADLSVVMLDE